MRNLQYFLNIIGIGMVFYLEPIHLNPVLERKQKCVKNWEAHSASTKTNCWCLEDAAIGWRISYKHSVDITASSIQRAATVKCAAPIDLWIKAGSLMIGTFNFYSQQCQRDSFITDTAAQSLVAGGLLSAFQSLWWGLWRGRNRYMSYRGSLPSFHACFCHS